jgi:cobaltochelatase CobN
MHILLRERHGLEETAAAEDLGQDAADLVVLSFSDSDLSAFAAAWHGGREQLPSLRLANLRRLAHPLSVDLYLQKTLSGARGILIRLLGGVEYWRYGVEQVSALAAAKKIALAIVPGDGRPDPRLDAASNLPPSTLRRLKTLCDAGGQDSARAALAQLALAAGLAAVTPVHRAALPRHGFYVPGKGVIEPSDLDLASDDAPIVVVVFYRAFLAASDTDPVDRLMIELGRRGVRATGLFAASLKDPESDGWLRHCRRAISPSMSCCRNWTAASLPASPRSSRSKPPIPSLATPARFTRATMDASPLLSRAPSPGSRCGELQPPTNASPSCCRPIRGAATRWPMPLASMRRRAASRC